MKAKRPSVSILTRTKDRPIFLARAGNSVCQQIGDFAKQWVIVNDGGKREHIEPLIEAAKSSGWEIVFINNDTPKGRAMAANQALEAATNEFIILHDDDDSLLPGAITQMADFLAQNSNVVSVVCNYLEIKEAISGTEIHELSSSHFCPPNEINIQDLATRNQFAPIAHMIRREKLVEIGGFDKDFDVLEDWLPNLRLAIIGTIGRIDLELANYHIRVGADGVVANSIIAENDAHLKSEKLIREKYIKQSIGENSMDIGTLLLFGALNRDVQRLDHSMSRLKGFLKRIPFANLVAKIIK